MLIPGDKAPDFSAPVIGGSYKEGDTIRLSDLNDKTTILYFYPKDDTPGCTVQACALRDHYKPLLDKGARIFGINVDSIESHRKFIEKHALPFPLISDEKKKIVAAYGVWVEKNFYGKKSMGVERSTFVIGKDGRIRSVFHRVKPDEHAETLLQDLAHFEP